MSSKSSLIRRLFYQYYSDLFYRISFKFNFSWKHIIFSCLKQKIGFYIFLSLLFKKRSLFIIKRGD